MKKFLSSTFAKSISLVAALFVVTLLINQSEQLVKPFEQAFLNTPAEDTAWGTEALVQAHETVKQMSPIAAANACGLGASSCFRCHNDKRAPIQNKDENEAPWHAQHDKVNYSCAGCHAGNPRILKQEIAHKGLIANPVSEADKTCKSCHGADADAKAKIYLDKHPKLGGAVAAEEVAE